MCGSAHIAGGPALPWPTKACRWKPSRGASPTATRSRSPVRAKVPVIRTTERWCPTVGRSPNIWRSRYPTPTLFGSGTGRAHAVFIKQLGRCGAARRDRAVDRAGHVGRHRPEGSRLFPVKPGGSFRRAVWRRCRPGGEDPLAAFRELLLPIRLVLRRQEWLGGAAPSYADHIIAGTLMWPRCASRFALLEDDDPVAQWQHRVLDLYGGLGREAKRA